MSTVVMHNVVSVDGYIADDSDDVGPLFEWYFNGDAELADGGPFKVSRASAGYVRPMWDSIGSMVIGRHLFDLTNGWEGKPPAGEHVVVVSHRPRPDGWHPEAAPPLRGRCGSGDREGEGAGWRAHRCGGGGRRRWAGARTRPGR